MIANQLKTLLLLILTLSVLTGCNTVKTSNTLNSAAQLKYQLKDANLMYQDGKKTYQEQKGFFTSVEQRLIHQSFTKIERAKTEIEKLYHSDGINAAIAFSRFHRDYSEMREAYSVIRGVLQAKDGIDATHQHFIDQIHDRVVSLDYLVDQLKPHAESIDYQAIAGIISATAALVGNVRPIVSS